MLSERGQTLIELIIVVAVGTVIISALTFAAIYTLRNAQFAKNQVQATKLSQEGIERVRTARDRDGAISGLNTGVFTGVNSWFDDAFWSNQIVATCSTPCYFKFDSVDLLQIVLLTGGGAIPSTAELINNQFTRVVVLGDSAPPSLVEKVVTVLVTWTDFSGSHESKLVTVLKKP